MTTHTPEDQELLDSMSELEKLERTTPESFKSRWKLIEEWEFMYISDNEMPDSKASVHNVLWLKDVWWKELGIQYIALSSLLLRLSQEWYFVYKNPPNKSSVKREHFHIVRYNTGGGEEDAV